jgi:hypothetical protein
MLYRQTNGSANCGPRCLSGASISQLIRHMSPAERAILGAELVDGRVVLEPPTAKTVGALVGVNQGYVYAALKLSPAQRGAVLAGERPLIEPRRCAPAPMDWGTLVEELKLIGTDKVLEAAVEAESASA